MRATPTTADPAHSFYLSSPRLGLERERALAQTLIAEAQQACRHSYGGSGRPPVATCQDDVRRSDHYLLILAGRYGTPQANHGGKSVTELEFEAALASGRSLRAFFLTFTNDIDHHIDYTKAGRARLAAFKQRVQQHCTIRECRDLDDFAAAIRQLAAAPPPRPGLMQADPTLANGGHTPHNLPHRARSGDGLIGRDEALARLEALLEAGEGPVLITGMDGVGKTALALHHLRRCLERYGGGVVLLDGQQPLAQLVADLALFMTAYLDQTPPPDLPPAATLAWITSHWPRPQPVLLVLDGLEDEAVLDSVGVGLPERFQLLATSRLRLGGSQRQVRLEPLAVAEAVALLEQLAERGPFSPVEQRQARVVAEAVGGLPLALQLLGHQLARDQDLELADLPGRLRQRGLAELQASFRLVWGRLAEPQRQLAVQLAALPRAAVPWELLELARPPGLDADGWDAARLELERQHLIERPLRRLVQLHPLLHRLIAAEALAQPAIEQQESQARLMAALPPWLAGISDVLEGRHRERLQRCLPLLEALAGWPAHRWSDAASALPQLARGRLLSGLGAYGAAEQALQGALERLRPYARATRAAPEAAALVALAGIARERGQLQRAAAQCRQALAGLAARAGETAKAGELAELALARAEALNGLGLAMLASDPAEAEPVLRQALALRLQRLDGADGLVQISRTNLAMALRRLDRREEATGLLEQVLADAADDPCEVAVTARNNLSFLAEDAGELERAHALRQDAVALAALALGDDHPNRGLMLLNLAVVAERLGRLEEAAEHYRRAAQLTAAAWGPEDPRSREAQQTLEAFLASHPAAG